MVIISGRDKATLERYFGNLRVALVAEHGVWLREPQGSWRTIEPLTDEWKEEIHPILELYVDRTPGSILEEKEFSLVWHYRKADQLFADVRLGELKEDLAPLLESRNLVILEGEGVLEVKRSGINKGRAALHWLAGEGWDFVLAVGDDQTDEDTFQVLPEGAYSVKVGLKPSRARFNLDSPAGVRALLRELVAAEARERR
ncbi:TPA: trehalose-phosphatase [Candidatus Bipolaricaulota bacterium]|nr:trehalose-phosphatase [Candidatus Bipolaricaulota bacterium]